MSVDSVMDKEDVVSPRILEIKAKMNKWDLIKIKSFCTTKKTIQISAYQVPVLHLIRLIKCEKKTDILFSFDDLFNSKTRELYYQENSVAIF